MPKHALLSSILAAAALTALPAASQANDCLGLERIGAGLVRAVDGVGHAVTRVGEGVVRAGDHVLRGGDRVIGGILCHRHRL